MVSKCVKKTKKCIVISLLFILIFGLCGTINKSYGAMKLITDKGKTTHYNNYNDSMEGGAYAAIDSMVLEVGMCARKGLSINGKVIPYKSVIYIETTAKGEGSFENKKYFWVADTGGGLADNQIDIFSGDWKDVSVTRLYSAPYGTYSPAKFWLVEENVSWDEFKKKYGNKTGGATGGGLININFPQRNLGYKDKKVTVKSITLNKIMEDADNFINNIKEDVKTIDQVKLSKTIKNLYYILLAIAIVFAVIIGLYLAIKLMLQSTAEGEARIKEMFIPYVIGCAVSFGAFTIWTLVMKIFNAM